MESTLFTRSNKNIYKNSSSNRLNYKSILNLMLLFGFLTSFRIDCGCGCDGATAKAKILIYFLQGSYSMLNVYHPYAVRLAEKGHEVTLLLGMKYKNPHPNIKYIVPPQVENALEEMIKFVGKNSIEARENRDRDEIQIRADSPDGAWSSLPPGAVELCQILLSDAKVLEWVNSPATTFDLVIVDALWNDCGIGLAYKFKAPHILFETYPILPWHYDTFGLPPDNSIIPDIRRPGLQHGALNFLQRVRNVLDTLETYVLHRQLNYMGQVDEIFKKAFNDPPMPSLRELEKNVSLVLVNSHFSSEVARSLPPLYVQVGGLQCEEVDVDVDFDLKGSHSKLPKDLADFVEKFPSFVYISFGTIFQLNLEKQTIFLETFKQFPNVGFIFRWVGKMPNKENVPDNTFLGTWVPQTQLLRDKKIAAFVSHGGMMSTQESVFYAVPVLVIPGFQDQDYNAECLKRLGVAVKLELKGLTVGKLTNGLKEILNKPTYKETMKKLSSLHRDRPLHPMDTAIWWTEYVIRNTANGNGLDHLKPLGMHQFWFQRRLLDVWLFLVVITIAVFSFTAIVLFKISQILLKIVKDYRNRDVIKSKSKRDTRKKSKQM